MPQISSLEELDEKVLEIVLNTKPDSKIDKLTQEEIKKLKFSIKKLINLLPNEEKEVLSLRYFNNLTSLEIAKRFTKSDEEINKILLSGIKSIKENLRKHGLQNEDVTSVMYSQGVENQALWIVGFIGMASFIGIVLASYFFIQQYFVKNLPSLSWLTSSLSSYVSEDLFGNKNKVTTNKNRNKKVLPGINQNTLKISGSSSLLALSKKWKESFNFDFSDYKVELIASDSDSGINSVIDGKIDIANSSRPITFSDYKKALARGVELDENRVAIDALIIVVSKKNPISELSLDNLKDIFNGDIQNWKELGGIDMPIIPIVREEGSGTNDFVKNRILQENDFPESLKRANSNEEIFNSILENNGVIGFTNSTNYPFTNKEIKYLKIKSYENSLSVSPFYGEKLDEEAMRYGDYPLAHYLYLITSSDAQKKVQDYVDWILGVQGQEIVKRVGLVSVVED